MLKTGQYLFLYFYCHSHFSYITLSQLLGITSHCSKLCSNLYWWHCFQKDWKLFLKHFCGWNKILLLSYDLDLNLLERALTSATQSGIACSETSTTVNVVPDPHEISTQGWILALILQVLLSLATRRSAIAADTVADSRRSPVGFAQTLLLWCFFLKCCSELQYTALFHSFTPTCGKILSILSQHMSETETSHEGTSRTWLAPAPACTSEQVD